MGFIRQKAYASGATVNFPQPTLSRSLVVLAISWVEALPGSDFLEFYDNATVGRPFASNTTDDGMNVYCPTSGGHNTFGTRILTCIEADPCQVIQVNPHRWHAAVDDGLYIPASLRVRAYEVVSVPGPLSGVVPQGVTNISWEQCACGFPCAGDGYGKADIDGGPSANPSELVTATDWADASGSQAFMIAVLGPGDDDGTGFSGAGVSAVAAPWVLDDPQGLTAVALLDTGAANSDQTATFTWGYNNNAGSLWEISVAAWEVVGSPPPPPPPPVMSCAPVDITSGKPVNGVFIKDLCLFIIPAWALYTQLVPFSQISLNETNAQGRRGIILDFNDSEGLYARDLGTIFTWNLGCPTTLDVWQPSIIPMDGEIYDRLSYHFTMTSLQGQGWQHAREMNIAYASTTPLNLLLTFDQWPSITLTLPSTSGATVKQKLTLPPNKWKMVELFLSSASPFKLWTNDLEMKLKTWGSVEPYRVARPVAG